MEKINSSSLDITQVNIEKLKELFPNIVTEGKIDFEMLRILLGDDVDDDNEKYQFTWKGKQQAIKLAQTPSTLTLRPCKEKSKEWETTENLYIEGDNLEVLKQLQKTYYGKLKMIYIDPPYNTGNDFIYSDDFKNSLDSYREQTNQKMSSNPESNGRYHTDWLNMMYPRLMLAKNLLKNNGAIFISIDDNEVCNLKKMCNEVFGEKNFLAQLIIVVKPEGRRYGYFAKTHEYILVYAKDINNVLLNELNVKETNFKYYDQYGGYNLVGLRNRNVQAFNSTNRPNLRYPFYVDLDNIDENGLMKATVKENNSFTKVEASIIDGLESVWRWGKEKSLLQEKDLVGYKGNDGEIRIFQKIDELHKFQKTIWNNKDIISNKGTKELAELLGKGIFDFPKPIELIKQIVEIGSNEDDIILDFFSGSSTTAHAIMKLNVENDEKRKFIMIQLPEKCNEQSDIFKLDYKNLCEIGEDRIRRAGEQIQEEWKKENSNEGLFADKQKVFPYDIGFKVFKLDSTNIKPWDNELVMDEQTLFNHSSDVFKEDRANEDILYEIMIKYGVFDEPVTEVKINGKTMYRVGKRHMIVCLDDNITSDDVSAISELKPKVVIFKESGFANDNDKINAVYNLEKAGIEDVKSI